jgi:hypothetical protein
VDDGVRARRSHGVIQPVPVEDVEHDRRRAERAEQVGLAGIARRADDLVTVRCQYADERAPDGPGVRDDSGVEAGAEISIYYDSLVSKLIVWGRTRDEAIARMTRALGEYEVSGIRTSLPFFRWMLREPAFACGEFHTGYLDELLQSRRGEPFDPPDMSSVEVAALALALRAAAFGAEPPAANPVAGVAARAVPSGPIRGGGWKVAARREGLRA